MSELSDRLEAARTAKGGRKKGWSNRYIAEQAKVSPPTVDRLFNGQVVTELDNLDAVADVLGVPRAEARELSARPPGGFGPYEAPLESRLLDVRQRRALDELIRSIVSGVVSDDGEHRATGIAGEVGTAPLPREDPVVDRAEDGEEGEDLTG